MDCEQKSQPNWGGVEKLGQSLDWQLERPAGEICPSNVSMIIKGVSKYVPGERTQESQEITEAHWEEDMICIGWNQAWSWENDHHDYATESGNEGEKRNNDSIDWLNPIEGTKKSCRVHNVAVLSENATEDVNMSKIDKNTLIYVMKSRNMKVYDI